MVLISVARSTSCVGRRGGDWPRGHSAVNRRGLRHHGPRKHGLSWLPRLFTGSNSNCITWNEALSPPSLWDSLATCRLCVLIFSRHRSRERNFDSASFQTRWNRSGRFPTPSTQVRPHTAAQEEIMGIRKIHPLPFPQPPPNFNIYIIDTVVSWSPWLKASFFS